MPSKVILVVLDGLNFEVAQHALGHLQAYCQAGRAALYQLSVNFLHCHARSMKPSDRCYADRELHRQ